MMKVPAPFTRLQESFKKLPGIGNKSAERFVYHVLEMSDESIHEFASALTDLKKDLHYCKECGQLCTGEICEICQDESRDRGTIMVVEKPQDVFAMEKINAYHGLYHVLHGVVSMIEGIGIEDLNIQSLINRIKQGSVKEVIIATNLTRDGETTALYLRRLLEPFTEVTVTRIAHGLPSGSNIDYADEMTLVKSLEGRTKI